MSVIHQCHVVGQGDKVIKTDRSVILRRFYLLNMVSLVEVECIVLSVKQDLTVFIGLQNDHFCVVRLFAEIEIRIFGKDPESDTRKLFTGIIAVYLDDFEGRYRAFAFIGVAEFIFAFVCLFISVYRDLVNDLLVSVSTDLGAVCNNDLGGIGNSKCCNSRSIGNAVFILAATDRIRDTDALRISLDLYRTVVKTQV